MVHANADECCVPPRRTRMASSASLPTTLSIALPLHRGATLLQHELAVRLLRVFCRRTWACFNKLSTPECNRARRPLYNTHLGVCGRSLREVLFLHAGIGGASSIFPSLPLPPLPALGVCLVHGKVVVWSQRGKRRAFHTSTKTFAKKQEGFPVG